MAENKPTSRQPITTSGQTGQQFGELSGRWLRTQEEVDFLREMQILGAGKFWWGCQVGKRDTRAMRKEATNLVHWPLPVRASQPLGWPCPRSAGPNLQALKRLTRKAQRHNSIAWTKRLRTCARCRPWGRQEPGWFHHLWTKSSSGPHRKGFNQWGLEQPMVGPVKRRRSMAHALFKTLG